MNMPGGEPRRLTEKDNMTRHDAYTRAKSIADASGATPGLDQWWAILKAAEADALAAPEVATAATAGETVADDSVAEWAAYARINQWDGKRWSVAHKFVAYSNKTVCGMDPGPNVYWASEGDSGCRSRCKRCLNA